MEYCNLIGQQCDSNSCRVTVAKLYVYPQAFRHKQRMECVFSVTGLLLIASKSKDTELVLRRSLKVRNANSTALNVDGSTRFRNPRPAGIVFFAKLGHHSNGPQVSKQMVDPRTSCLTIM